MSKAKVLIVEDDAIILYKLRHTLETIGYLVVGTANSGEKAIEAALKENPDLVLMDIRLKGTMDGIQATEKIREHLEVPVIFMTAYSDEEKIKRAKRTMPYGYLLKPVQDKELEVNMEIALHVARVEAEKRVAEEERKKLQQQLFQAQKMESLGTLAGGIAHDFNNLLFQIMGSIQIAKKRLPVEDASFSNLSNALQAAFRAKDLVHQILTFSRKTKSEHSLTQVQPIVKQALTLLRSSLPATIEIRQEIDNRVGPIDCDSTQIYQVLMNLCTNAFHAIGDEPGLLTVILKENEKESALELSVCDTGQGMEPEIVNKIYEPYFTTKDTGEGTGLGLSIVHGIVSNHNGRIEVKSEPGIGSTFRILFPLVGPRKAEENPRSSQQALPRGTECILAVDDEELIVKMEAEILESIGYTVEGFNNSVKAFDAFKADPDRYDLVLTDQTMPYLTGFDLAQKMMEIKPDVCIVLLTGFSESVSEKQALAIGIKKYIMKPLDMYNLANSIRQALDQ